MQRCTDPALHDEAGAIDCLPVLKLDSWKTEAIREPMKATGTEAATKFVAPTFAPNSDYCATFEIISDSSAGENIEPTMQKNTRNRPLFRVFFVARPTGVEPVTLSSED